jgi:hypothetical protein
MWYSHACLRPMRARTVLLIPSVSCGGAGGMLAPSQATCRSIILSASLLSTLGARLMLPQVYHAVLALEALCACRVPKGLGALEAPHAFHLPLYHPAAGNAGHSALLLEQGLFLPGSAMVRGPLPERGNSCTNG